MRLTGEHSYIKRFTIVFWLAAVMGLLASCASASYPTALSPAQSPALIVENSHQGSTGWLPGGGQATTDLQAYASAGSVSPGQPLTLYVSSSTDGALVKVAVYRLGWYNGAGARLMMTSEQTALNQGHYDASQHLLVACDTCVSDPVTHLVEANWAPTLTFTVPTSWYTGDYDIIIANEQAQWTYVSFVVLGAASSTYVAMLPVTTWQAYNDWGGYSLYHGADGTFDHRATMVSFDRPLSGEPLANSLAYEIDAIRWMERMGYDVSYITSVDLHEHPDQLLAHRAFLSLGHDEYWSSQMRAGVERARDAGVGLVFLGANTAYWQIRFQADSLGHADHTIVCYKWPPLDPLHGKDDAHVTDLWRNVGQPENALIGIMSSLYHSNLVGFPWHLDPSAASSSLIRGTGLIPNTNYGCDFVGYEWDRVFDNGSTPPGLHILATSPVTATSDVPDTANTAYYVAPSGALVFAAGSIYWAYALDDLRLLPTADCLAQSAHNAGMQQLMANVMAAIITHHPANWQ